MGHFNLERRVWAKAIAKSQYYSHVIWVPMILLLQHALIHTKNFLPANKNIPDEGQGSWFMKSQESPCFVKNMLSTYTKDFSWKKMSKICQILKGFFFKLPVFMIKFH